MNQQLIGRYQVLEDIAVGGQGNVYKAIDPLIDRTVAIKVLKPELTSDGGYLERFYREAALAAQIDHPNVVKIYDMGEDDGRHFIVMEYLPRTLADLIPRDKDLSIDRVLELGGQIAEGLAAAHSRGITHRDVKPQNVLITQDGDAKVTDFGIARAEALSTMTATGMIMGTPYYMSPEQARGTRVDVRSDVYSLGCVMYQMLAGEVPFQGTTPIVVLRQHMDDEPRPIRERRREVPRDLARVVERAMEKDPDDRYQSAGDLAEAIRSVSAGKGRQAKAVRSPGPETPTVDAPPPVADQIASARAEAPVVAGTMPRRSRMPIAIVGVLAITVVLVAISIFVQNSGSSSGAAPKPPQAPAAPVPAAPAAPAPAPIAQAASLSSPATPAPRAAPIPAAPAPAAPAASLPIVAAPLVLAATPTTGPPAVAAPEIAAPAPVAPTATAVAAPAAPAPVAYGNLTPLSAAEVEKIVEAAVRAIPGVTEADIQGLVAGVLSDWEKAVAGQTEPLSVAEVVKILDATIMAIPTPTPAPKRPSSATAEASPSGKIVFGSDRGGNSDIYVMNADGSNLVRLTDNPKNDGSPLWSPDGSKIAFFSNRDGNPEIYVMNADGSNQVNLTNNSASDWLPTWSPDGSKIAFVSDLDAESEIYVMNADGSNQVRLTNNSAFNWSPTWSPEGGYIAYVSNQEGTTSIYVVNADGSNQVRLTNNLNQAWDRQPSWSPDGSKITFLSVRAGNNEIYVMNADGSDQIRLTNIPASDSEPSWSPDGGMIAFESSQQGGNVEIYVMNADGSNLVKLTNNPEADVIPSWSPDSRKIAFMSLRDGNNEIYVMNADGSDQVNLTNNSASDLLPTWSPIQ